MICVRQLIRVLAQLVDLFLVTERGCLNCHVILMLISDHLRRQERKVGYYN